MAVRTTEVRSIDMHLHSSIAVSTSESPDMAVFGLSDDHLTDAMAELALHLLASGARLGYGGDLRKGGFTELLFELATRYRRDAADDEAQVSVTNYLAWPVHATMDRACLEDLKTSLSGVGEIVCLDLHGQRLPLGGTDFNRRPALTNSDWTVGLTAMRRVMRTETQVRIVLGGPVDGFKGSMPGIAEEALLSFEARQPLFLVGGFGGCTRDIAETLGLVDRWVGSRPNWSRRSEFETYGLSDLRNGLSDNENRTLAHTPHIDQAVILILRGLFRLSEGRRSV